MYIYHFNYLKSFNIFLFLTLKVVSWDTAVTPSRVSLSITDKLKTSFNVSSLNIFVVNITVIQCEENNLFKTEILLSYGNVQTQE